MSQRTYTTPVQEALFKSLAQRAGIWSSASWKSGKPVLLSTKQWSDVCDLIHQDLVKKFKGAAPKTARSINMAVWFTLELLGSKPQQPYFRISAYHSGFLTMTDIVELEKMKMTGVQEESPIAAHLED